MKKEKIEKKISKLLSGDLQLVIGTEIRIGEGGIGGSLTVNQQTHKFFEEAFGEKYLEIFENFRKKVSKINRETGMALTQLVIESAIDNNMVIDSGVDKEEMVKVLTKLGELLGRITPDLMNEKDDEDEDNDEDDDDEDEE